MFLSLEARVWESYGPQNDTRKLWRWYFYFIIYSFSLMTFIYSKFLHIMCLDPIHCPSLRIRPPEQPHPNKTKLKRKR